MGKFSKAATKFETDLGALFNRAIRQALLAGLAMAISNTKQDSSNAAAHWTIKAKGRTRSSGRAWTKLRDLRETSTRKRTPPVGRRRDGGSNAAATLAFVRQREMREVIDKFVAGRQPATVFSFFNPVDEGSEYGQNLDGSLSEAGKAAVEEVYRILQNRIASGQTRKRRL